MIKSITVSIYDLLRFFTFCRCHFVLATSLRMTETVEITGTVRMKVTVRIDGQNRSKDAADLIKKIFIKDFRYKKCLRIY